MSPWPALYVVYTVWGCSEAGLALLRRASSDQTVADRSSFRILVAVILLCIPAGLFLSFFTVGRFTWQREALAWVGGAVMVVGIVVRWVAILQLGRFFTVNVALAPDHRVVDVGLYRWVRHPSYAGALLTVLGFVLALGSWWPLLVSVLPLSLALAYRIRVEEAALLRALGREYELYMERTARLVPFLY